MDKMLVDLVWLAVLALSLPALSQSDPLFVFIAPNLLRVGSKENVFVEAQEYAGGDLNVEIMVKNFPAKTREIFSKTVTLTAANNFQALQEILIPDDDDIFDKASHRQQFVYLQAKFPQRQLEKVILLSFQSGYIFVQTDKTIYTPASTVHYRLFALNPGLQPVTSSVSVEIMTPDGITIQKHVVHTDNGTRSGQYKLPEIVSIGTWKVVSRFQHTPQKNFTADFQVKEYVLPSFEVKIVPEQAFFYIDDAELSVDLTARYLYGNDVTGKAFVVFGVLTEEGEKKSFPASLQKVDVISGKGKATLRREHILKSFPDINQLLQLSLYVSVSVLTSSGSEMVEAEKRGVLIVTSPYSIHFHKTPTYFKPGMPFQVRVYVTNPDGSPAKEVPLEVTPGQNLAKTEENGFAVLKINTQRSVNSLSITVRTKVPGLPKQQQAEKNMTAQAYKTQLGEGSNNYLHIGIQAGELKIGQNPSIDIYLGDVRDDQLQNKHLTYLIISKGQLVHASRYKTMSGHSVMTISLPVTKDMIPSFRFVAYYHVGTEVVSDSVWVDVKDTCMGTLEITVPQRTYEPGKPFSLTITGDPGAKVGLVAVDKGVYVLNSHHRLTQTKIWDVVEKHDIGCTAGSGADSMAVFYDAGLVFESNFCGTKSRTDPQCPVHPKARRRRSLSLIDLKTSLASNYSGLAKECCKDGMVESLMGYTCERRSQFIIDGEECVKAFLHCCSEVDRRHEEAKTEQLLLARSDEVDDYISSDDIVSRTQFPESWLWEEETLPQCPPDRRDCVSTSVTKKHYLKDSITTWEITAVSLSKTHGICVADPLEMRVRKDFFIDLKLPYAAVRNEQLEVKAVLYNYLEEEIKVRVELMETEEVCSAASRKRKYRMDGIEMDPMSSRAVPFVIIPMALGQHSIEVKAAVFDSSLTDGVKKDLRVVAEGVKTTKEIQTVVLKPSDHGGVQVEKIKPVKLTSQVPESPAHTHISVTGEVLSQTIQAAISGQPMGSLITQPTGCGEQNMISMTSPVIATHYLDKTGQWDKVGVDRRAQAIKYIQMGYTQQLAYRKTDGSYAAWIKRPSSTWLTAYVAKVFSMAYSLISIQEDVICNALKWLVLNAQQPDGIFKEDAPVYHGEMVGDVRGKDADASMTAFVLIAMQEARAICVERVNRLPDSMKKASEFLSRRINTLTNPYAVAMTSYALALEGKHQLPTLLRFASADKTHWPVPGGNLFTLEATGYALMALVKAKEFDQAGRVVKWLTEQRFHGGGYGSTQATIVVFQAVAEYMMEVSDVQEIDLQVSLDISGRSRPVKWTFTNETAHVTRSEKTLVEQDLKVTATGSGQGTMSVVTLYHALPEDNNTDCKNFDLQVKIEKQPEVGDENALETYKMTIEMTYLSPDNATMSILDITMLTGFTADEKDLERLTSGRDRYVQKIETDKQLSDKGSLIFYLDKVSNMLSDKVVFRVHKMTEVGLLQPAAVTLYEYYAMENRCMKFYHPQKKGGALNRICHEEVCRCAEENCSFQRKQRADDLDRATSACEAGMDYAYKAKVLHTDLTPTLDRFTIRVEEVIKEGTDTGVTGKERIFMAHPYCREAIDLTEGKTYLIMGKSDDLIRGEDRLLYMLGGGTWIEYWPTEAECQEPQYRDTCLGITTAAADLQTFGCPT
ncbi:complement C3-like [Megalops cyprinoides]|uniref:complement C3-like n=1 Tax=Megalops cyprinoides TaxID=118141 RepID=UPI001864D068|nr:complement C3-like [Megalops cyprinoides]